MIDLMGLQPHKVSKDLRGYSVLFYGAPKSGKTTIASKFPDSLLLAFEKGYSALAGVNAQPLNSWSEFLQVLMQLKTPDIKAKFSTIVIDTADVAYEYAEQYICQTESVEAIGNIPFGQGFTKLGKEFDVRLRQIVQMGYGLVLISHAQDKTFTNEDGTEYNKIVPTLANKARLITTRMCDIIGFSAGVDTSEGTKTNLYMRGTSRFEAGSRFKYTPNVIEFSYNNLVKAISDAIDKQSLEDGSDFFTEERDNVYLEDKNEVDFDDLIRDFQSTTDKMVERDANYYGPRIMEIVSKHLGQGKTVSGCSRSQAMIVDIIIHEVKDISPPPQ